MMAIPQILVVEDEAIVAANLADCLIEDGYHVAEIVDSGPQAIAYAQNHSPDLVLMDIVLKGEMDGITAAETIHSKFAIPIIYMTAYSDQKTLDRAKTAQPLAYLVKPFRPQELKATIEIALSRHQQDQLIRQNLQSAEQQCSKAEKLNDLQFNFIKMISHELRTPLTQINFSTDLLEADLVSGNLAKPQTRLAKIRKAIAQIITLLDHALALIKLDSPYLPLEVEPINLGLFCQEVIQDHPSSHPILISMTAADPTIYQDKSLLTYILNNLISNAIKYSHSSVELKIEDSTPEVIIKVIDQGIGIPLADQPYLFESGFRSQNVGNIKGTGLGLAIARKAAEILGGSISLHSQLGVGSTFTVTLPRSIKQPRNFLGLR